MQATKGRALLPLTSLHSPPKIFEPKKFFVMKKETWKTILQFIVSILTAALTAFGTTSCLGHGPLALL